MRAGFNSPSEMIPFSWVVIFRTKVNETKIKFRSLIMDSFYWYERLKEDGSAKKPGECGSFIWNLL